MSEKWKWYHKKKPYRVTEDDTPEVSYQKLTAATFLILGIVCTLGSLVLCAQWSWNKGVPVKQEYTNYLNAAAEMYDPVLIVQTLERALVGIENLGLKPTDSGAAFSWDVNYHHSIAFNIDQIKTAIEYGNTVVEWREQSYHGTVVENVNDVYTEKMIHLKQVAKDPDTINIATAYCFNNKPELFWFVYAGYAATFCLITTACGFLIAMFCSI